MLIVAEDVKRSNHTLILHIPNAKGFLSGWLDKQVQAPQASLRFAVGKSGDATLLIFGVRVEGRGFDVGVPKKWWDELTAAAEQILIDAGEGARLELEFPEEGFESFLNQLQAQAQEFPERAAIVEVADYFFSEETNSNG